MKALVFREKGKAEEVLALETATLNQPLIDEVTVKVLASPINPNDFMFIEKQYRQTPIFPQIGGFEGCGLIIDNNGISDLPVHSLVAFRHHNVWAEYVNVPREKLLLLPNDYPIEKAAQLSLNPLTAKALLDEVQAQPNEWIILSAGSSAISKLFIQFAKTQDIKTLAIVRNDEQRNQILEIGATAVITDTNIGDLESQINSITNNEIVSGFVDAVGGELATQVIKCLSVNGKVILYGLLSSNTVTYHNSTIIFKNLTIKGFGIDNWAKSKSKPELEGIWESIKKLVQQDNFKLAVAGKSPISEYKRAIAASKTTANGKVLFWFDK